MALLWVFLLLLLFLLLLGYVLSRRMTDRHRPDEARSPADYGLAYEEVAFSADDGVMLRGWWVPSAGAERALILLHGQAGSMDPDVQYLPALHAAGFHVLQFDFRAHGRSEGRVSTIGYLERQDVLGAVAFVRGKGVERIGLLGFSMGARVAILAAPLCPQVRAIVADGGPPRMLPAIAARLQETGLSRFLGRPLAWLLLAVTSIRVRANLFRWEPLHQVGRVACPILFIHGDQDPYIPASEFAALVAAAQSPVEVWRVPEAGHRMVDQFHPEEYRRRVVAFFDRYA